MISNTQTDKLARQIALKKSLLCVGLDTDIQKIPSFLSNEEDPVFAFNKAIIEATHSYTVAYKPNIAFYESMGINGWNSLKKTIDFLRENHPDIFTIADAKRGDIGNTSQMYAKTFFEYLDFDSVTVAPYMGEDSVKPFLDYKNKITILLALTSNQGAFDFQTQKIDNIPLYQKVLENSKKWASNNNLMYVVGATKASLLEDIRQIIPNHFLLIPGVGSQGGNLEEVCQYGINSQYGLLINSSRGILYASNQEDFDQKAANEAQKLQKAMNPFIL